MKRKNKQSLFEQRLNHIISRNIKRFINESQDSRYGEITYNIFDNMNLSEEEYEELENLFQGKSGEYKLTFKEEYETHKGDYYTPSYVDSNIELYHDGGFYKDIKQIPNETLQHKVIEDFENFCDEAKKDETPFEDSITAQNQYTL